MRNAAARVRSWIQHLGIVGTAAVFLLIGLTGLVAQNVITSGAFSRIYMGGYGTNNPQIRWGSADPTGACTPGSLYLQKQSGLDAGLVWMCGPSSGVWRAVGSNRDVYDIRDFGAKCDGTDDTVAIQAAVDAALNYSNRSGTVQWAPTACNSKTIIVGAITTPWLVASDDALNLTGVGFAFNAPRAATINYTASSSTITFVAGVITSDDVGNYVFYGTADSEYSSLFSETRVLQPTYGCEITAIISSTSATCVVSPYEWQASTPLAATTGAHASYITDDHSFTLDDTVFNTTPGLALDPDHVGKTMRFAVPLVRAYKGFDNNPRSVGSHVLDESLTASPCAQSDPLLENWQCLDDQNVKTKYFDATITAVTDPTHGKMHINGAVLGGSNSLYLFPDYPVHAGTGGVCGGPDANCAANASHQWGHLVPPELQLIGKNPHLDHYATPDRMSDLNELQNKHTYAGNIYPYTLPVDTNQRYITIKGASQATSGLNFIGCPTDGRFDDHCAALIFSKNKYFRLEDMYVNNASGSDADDTTQIGIYLGGLPGGGTQALVYTLQNVNVAGFGVCWQFGENLGGETSDSRINQVAAEHCGIGFRAGPGSYNTLDLHFSNLLMSFNKVGFLNYEGNMFVTGGSSSYNTIDFLSAGFGPFTISNFRTEGPGVPVYGGEPGLIVRSMNIAEPQATRVISGDVTAAPSSTHTVAGVDSSNVSVGLPAGSFYAITFGAGDITAADLRKLILFPGVGASGNDMVGMLYELTSSTTATVQAAKASGFVSAGSGLTVTVYDTNLADLTFPTDEIVAGDIGAAVALPNSTVTALWNRGLRCIVTEVSSTTTGKCGFYWGVGGGGPVKPGGGTDTDPSLFVNTAVMLEGGPSATFEDNIFATGRVIIGGLNAAAGEYTFRNNRLLSMGQWPITFVGNRKHYALDISPSNLDISALPAPTSALGGNTGLALPWTLIDPAVTQQENSLSVTSQGNQVYIGVGPEPWPLNEGHLQGPIQVENAVQELARDWITYDTARNPFAPWRMPGQGGAFAPRQRLAAVKELSEARGAAGNNLRFICHFATSDTCTGSFSRTESVTTGLANFDAPTRTYTMTTTSGHFTQEDVGKAVKIVGCCAGENGADFWGVVLSIVNATHITVRQVSNRANNLPNGPDTYTAVIGEDEPDALWIPILGGCTGIDTAGAEVIDVTSWTASGITLTSSNATSTATCRVLVVR